MGPGRVRERLVAVFEVDVRSLAVLRAGLGLLLLIDLVLRSRDLVAHYTDAGVLPRAVLFELGASRWLASVHFVNGTWAVQALLFAAAAIAAVALLVGYRTRLASVVCWGMLVSVNARNPLVVLGGDVLMRVALFWAMFLPLGARWSVDRALGRTTGPPARSVVSGGTVAYLVQMVLVYGISALRKSSPEWRSEGSALYYALSLDHLTTPLGEALLAFPGLLRVLTHGVFWLEVMAPVLLLAPVWKVGARCLVIGALALMHLGIAATLRVGLFPWIAVVTLVPFLPGPVWDALDAWARRVLGPWSGGRDREPEIATAPAGAAAPGPRSGVGRRPRFRARVADAAALLLLGYVLLWNVMALPASPVRFSERAQSLAYLLGLDQTWSMFAPHPLKNDGWYVLPARLRSGEVVDLMRGGRPVTWEKPQPASADYPNARWRRLMMALADHPEYAPAYADYVCRRWNRTHEAGRAVEELEIVFVLERTLPDYRSSEPRPRLLLRHRCPPETGRARSGPELFRPGREGADPDRRRA